MWSGYFNNTDHRTDLNGVDRLIVRRGQPFTIKLHLGSGSAHQQGLSSLTCTAETGPSPSDQYGTRAVFNVADDAASLDSGFGWHAALSSPPLGDVVTLSIRPAADAPIGRYTLTLGGAGHFEFILLFNPWRRCVSERRGSLDEYILSQDGIIFRGNLDLILPFSWNFGQFESGILDICLKILDTNPKYLRNPGKDCSGRRNAIYVSRVLSAMVNCNDDHGVLLGRWQDPYDGGKSPMYWTGSVDILLNWDSSSCSPVCFGQCWVNSDLVLERYFDQNNRNVGKEMIWNYHCWVESWMTRPDLKPDFGGWQVMDPTPQEKSEGVYCCGPVPVKAIKQGELLNKYDAPFVFAEVNADAVTYIRQEDGSRRKIISTTIVGQKISTKGVGVDRREDITHLYKYSEGSEEERESFRKANHLNKLLNRQEQQGLRLDIKVSKEMRKGCDFDVFAVVSNSTAGRKTCRLLFSSIAVSYTGVLKENCGFKDLLNVELDPGAERRVPLRLNYSKYCDAITEDNLIRLAAMTIDGSTQETVLALRDIVLENPEIKVRILGEPKKNRKLAAEITVQNPLPVPLSNCCFTIEGANLTGGKTLTQSLPTPVQPGEEAKVKIYFKPNHSGLRKLGVNFSSNKLCHVKGYKNVIIGN
ncbi:hypothetical protein CRUP_017901 [Coryphaenoides rupestris]|nr:hypothetical protein CRUP_017901 [Coryphaenoides rupestris]